MIPINKLDAALKRYYRSVRCCLPSSRKLKAKILSEIQSNVTAYLHENPDADFVAVEARFGAPEQIAYAYIDELETPELLHRLHIRKWVIRVTIGVTAIILLIWLAAISWAVIREYYHSDGTIINTGSVEITP